uniref:Slc16a-26 n=1 Tax=Schmidtea mediterranea TaxID=79327 RepID=A0A0H3YJ12_SCHMD|nr:slc16a-26 [Schmidtea mediterranea]
MKRKSSLSSSKEVAKKKTHGLDQWKALITSFLMQSLTLGTLESFGALYVPIMDTLLKDDPLKSTKAALVGSLTTGFLMGFSPISSMLINKLGAQLIALLGGVIVFISTLVSSFMTSFYFMALFYGVFFGIGCSMLFISSNVVISRYFQENSTVAYGILGLGNGLMNSIMPHVISYSVASIQLAGTIRIICFLLSSIMFFPLYWSSYKYDNKDEPVIAYLPARLLSTKLTISKHAVNDRTYLNEQRKSSKLTKETDLKNAHKAELNDNCCLYTRKKPKIKKHINDPNIHDSIIKANNSNGPNAPVTPEAIEEQYSTQSADHRRKTKKKEILDDGKSNPKTKFIISDINFQDIGLFQKSMTSAASSSIGDDLYNRFSRESTHSSTRTRDHLLTIFKNFKCCQAEVFKSKPYVTLLFGMFIAMFGYQVPNVHIVKFAQEISSSYNGQLLLTCLGGSSAIGPFINGIIMDRFACRISKYRLYQIFVIGYGIVILTLTITTNYSILIVVCLAIGFLDGSFSCLIGPLAIDLVGVHNAGQAIGIFFGVIAPSVMVAPPLAGFLFESFHNYKYAFYGAGLFFLIGGLLLSISHTTPSAKDPLAVKGDFTPSVFATDNSENLNEGESESALSVNETQKNS